MVLASCLTLLSHAVFSQNPSWVWAKGVHTSVSEWATDVAVDPVNGDIVAVGVFNSDLSAYYGLNFVAAIGGGFVARYDANGNVLWAFPIGNNADDACNSVTISATQNIYVTGYFQNIADFRGTSLVSNVQSTIGGKDIFVAKYNMAGQLQWVQTAGGMNDDEGYSVCTNTNNIFLTGYFTGSGYFSGIPTISNQPTQNLFVASYDANGNIQWLTDGGSGQSTFGRDIVADNNSVFVTGDFKNASLGIYDYTGANSANLSNVNSLKEDAFVMSLSVTGPFNWIKGIQSSNSDFGRGITQNQVGLYVTGSISSGASFPGYTANPVDAGAVGLDPYVAQLSKVTGTANWVKAEQGSANEEGMSICTDTANLICVTGYYQDTLRFSGSSTLVSTGNEDVFVAGYDNTGINRWTNTAGYSGTDIAHGISAAGTGEIYVSGEYANNARFGPDTLIADSPKNIFLAKIGCTIIGNNTITAAQTVCSGQSPSTLNGSLPTGGTSFTYQWQSSSNNTTWSSAAGVNSNQNYSPTALTSNTYFRRIVMMSGGCINADTSASILITVNQQPTPANAGPDSTICFNSINLYGNTITVGTATWTVISGGGTIASANSPTTSVTGLAAGAHVFVWSSSNGVCAISRDTVKITVNGASTPAAAGADQTICTTSYTLNGNAPVSGSGMWSVITGGGALTSPSLPNSAVIGLSTGANQFVWTISNSCGSTADTVKITVNAQPTAANAGSNATICAPAYTLAANTPTVGTGSWTVIAGSGIISNVSQPNSGVNGLSVGANSFVWTISNGVCQASKDTVTITVNAPPSPANAGTNQAICATTFTLNANTPAVGSGLWSVASGGGTLVSPGSHNSVVNALSVGNNIFVWTISNGVCQPSSDSVTISVSAMPSAANAGSNQSICNDSTNLNAAVPAVGSGSWSVVSGGGIVANPSQNNSLAYNLSVGSNIFQWTVTNGVCPASTSTVNINVSANPPTANAGGDQTICTPTVTLAANTPSTGVGNWTVVSGGATVTTLSSPNSLVTGLTTGQNIFVWSISNGVCPSSSDTVTINVATKPSVANAGADQNVCVNASSATMSATVPSVGTGSWSVVTGSGTFSGTSQNNANVSGLSIGQNIFVWTVSNSVCPSNSDSVRINVFPMPISANAGNDTTVSAGPVTLHGNSAINGTGSWSVISGAGTFVNAGNPSTQVSDLDIGNNVFSWTISNGVCPDSRDEVSVHVNDLAIPNGFSPNGDGVNDSFEIPGLTQFKNVKFEVFNRWGNMVYRSDDYRNDWNGNNMSGEKLTDDTYYYVLVIAKKEYKGFVVLKKNAG